MTTQAKLLTTELELKAAISLLQELDSTPISLSTVQDLCSTTGRTFGLYDNEILVSAAFGHIIPILNGDTIMWIFYMATAEQKRGSGYGRELMSYIEEYAKDNGCNEIRVHSSNARKPAWEFYEGKLSYTRWARLYRKVV